GGMQQGRDSEHGGLRGAWKVGEPGGNAAQKNGPAGQGRITIPKPAGLLQLGFFVINVLASDGIELLDQHLLGQVALVLGGGVEVARASSGLELDLFADAFGHVVLLDVDEGGPGQATSPRARRSASTASMPTLSMMRMALAETRRRTQRFSLSTQNRRVCRLGRKRRLVLLLACETLLPVIGALPVTWHTRAMVFYLCSGRDGEGKTGGWARARAYTR